jgi:HSP20 family molecular chaperone IbpA
LNIENCETLKFLDEEKIEAKYEKGVLKLMIPKGSTPGISRQK